MIALDVILALFAIVMIARNGALAMRLFRGERRAGTWIGLLNVVLAAAILAVAVKGLAGSLISR